jgi:hypothetical protein
MSLSNIIICNCWILNRLFKFVRDVTVMSRDVKVVTLVNRGRYQGEERYCRAFATGRRHAAAFYLVRCPAVLACTRVIGAVPCCEPVRRRRQQHHLGFHASESFCCDRCSCCVVSTLTNRVLLPSAPKPRTHLF